jgi:hypothetical protein|tara:strand:+ start:610 stop:1059 length:450 start_codon:yes stop_codon:yes gene_type:complete
MRKFVSREEKECVMQYEEVVGLLVAARKVKVEIDSKIKRLEREVLETKFANDAVQPIRNQGGERTVEGVTFEIKRTYVWDQELLAEALKMYPSVEDWPSFVTPVNEVKVNLTKFKQFCLDHADHPLLPKIHGAMSAKFGDPKIKAIKEV